MIMQGQEARYIVGNAVGDGGWYRLYICQVVGTDKQCLLQIAASPAHNGALERSSHILAMLKKQSDALEKEYADKGHKGVLNYDLCFPEVHETFISTEQGNRRVNILSFRNVPNIGDMVPLSNITAKSRRRVDLRTSAWIMGKTLKVLTFAHSLGIAIRLVNDSNILINPDQHYVVVFDWSQSFTHPDIVPAERRVEDISQAARAVITALGGGLDSRSFITDVTSPASGRYIDFLYSMARGMYRDAAAAHKRHYEIVDDLWERKFYPFTSLPLND